ncbi:shikimate kinase [Campylobacter sp. FMV-PI01]|uniref:Shikimate kinase n=1 Tax=Campylobacter portucalensis TaxID=2608384 RepID=A0A6L5WG96_9BACT|nr:shikimate kinase [Campylobacter portucalensis]MSN96188.1 shikimate kinase [Campylobacter portucalensis]
MKKKNNIVLIGFMGVGKGTIARELYKQTGKFPIDCDDLIESATNLKIKEIFEIYGEDKFRKIEKDLAKFILNSIDNSIISTGGGFYKAKNLAKFGKIIYLKASFDYIISRIKNSPNADKKIAKRPLLANLDEAKKLYNERDPKYAKKADFIVNVENKSPKQIAKEIKKLIKG